MEPLEQDTTPEPPVEHRSKKKKLIILLVSVAAAILLTATILIWLIYGKPGTSSDTSTSDEVTKTDDKTKTGDADAPTCDGLATFADHSFGAAFCYPSDWGDASVVDAKVGPDDTGHREMVQFSANPLFAVGGVSEDWSTTVGRDVGCLEPSNQPMALSEYDTEWHDIIGSGADISYAMRSLPSSAGGYDITEEVSNLLLSGVCTRGHKVIDGSRYRVVSAAFHRDFAEASGITTPKLHIDNPTVLFSTTQRAQLDALLASIVAY